jgi:hypothetical protein
VTATVSHQDVPSEVEPGSLDDLVADAAEVTRQLAEVPGARRVLVIPERARRVVADLDSYGD